MPDKVKNQILEKFKNKSTKILLATTVIEVGIDVPDANIWSLKILSVLDWRNCIN